MATVATISISDRRILAIFDLQDTSMSLTKFQVSWPFGSGEEAMAAILDFRSERVKLFFFDLPVTPMLQPSLNWPFGSGEDSGHLGFPIGNILAIFDLQVTPMLPTKFRVNWFFRSGEEAKNKFSKWRPWRLSWISDRNDFSYF